MVIKENITIPELTGDTKRRLYIYLPTDMKSEKRYPVLYMFDGHNVFYDEDATYGKSWGMKRYLDITEAKLIVVAVECNHEGCGRLHEYSPFPCPRMKPEPLKGLGGVYMDWMVKSLKPYIDSHFPTLSDRTHTYIAGSSMGGLMTVYALAVYNDIFSRGAALSPSLWIGSTKVMEMIKNAQLQADTWLYMDYGSEELNSHNKTKILSIFKRAANAFMDGGAYVCSRIIPGGTHCEASWEQQIPIFMQCLGITSQIPEVNDYDVHWDDEQKTKYFRI